jgi:hypothetical protein
MLISARRQNQLVHQRGLNVGDVRVRLIHVNLPVSPVLSVLPNKHVAW